MRSGERSSKDIVREHLDRIGREQPKLNAATQVFRDKALAEAHNPAPGPLSGLPIRLKETFGIESCEVTMGSRRMRPIQCTEDSEWDEPDFAAARCERIVHRGNFCKLHQLVCDYSSCTSAY